MERLMSDKHTPGPWFIQEGKYYACVRTDKRVIADMRTVGNVVPNMNDARLIAAAPDLFGALIDARKQLEEYERYISGEKYNSLMINATIAKATGEDK